MFFYLNASFDQVELPLKLLEFVCFEIIIIIIIIIIDRKPSVNFSLIFLLDEVGMKWVRRYLLEVPILRAVSSFLVSIVPLELFISV